MRLSLYLMALAGANIVLGFGYNWYLLTWLGPGRPTDALFAGMMIPQVLAAVVGGALTNALVPMLSVEAASRRALLGWTFAQAVLLATGGGAILLALAAPLWVPLTVPAFDADAVRLTIHLLRVQLIGVVLLSVATVQRAIHNAAHRYIWVEVTGLIATVAGLGVLVGGLRVWGVEAAAWATVAKAVLHGTLLLPAMGSYHGPAWGRPELRRAWQRLWPLMAGSLYYKSDVVLDRTLGSLAAPGVLSVYHLAHQAYASAQLVLGKAIVGPAVPALGRAAERGDWTVFRRITRRRLAAVLLIAIAGFIALVLVGRPMLRVAFGHGRFGPEAIGQLWWLLIALGGVWVGGAAGQILGPAFYAQGDTRTPTRVGSIGFTLAIVLKIAGFYFFGIWGVAAGYSVQYAVSSVALYVLLERRLRSPKSVALPVERVGVS